MRLRDHQQTVNMAAHFGKEDREAYVAGRREFDPFVDQTVGIAKNKQRVFAGDVDAQNVVAGVLRYGLAFAKHCIIIMLDRREKLNANKARQSLGKLNADK